LIRSSESFKQKLPGLNQLFRSQTSEQRCRVYQVNRRIMAFENQYFQRQIEGSRNVTQQQNRNISLAGFELR
jgi:hypothetical protein